MPDYLWIIFGAMALLIFFLFWNASIAEGNAEQDRIVQRHFDDQKRKANRPLTKYRKLK